MTRLFYSCLLIVVLTCSCNIGKSTKKSSNNNCKSKVTFNKTCIELGNAQNGEILGATFWVRNTGECPWVVSSIDNGCGCTKVQMDDKPLMVGDSLTVTVLFDTSGFEGHQIKMVTLFDNTDGGKQELLLTAAVN